MNKKSIFYTGLGTFLEWFEFGIFGYVAIYLAQDFLPMGKNPTVELIYTFGIFGLGYISRPIGGFIFGHLGDKLGRKKMIVLSSFIMSFAMLFTAILPTFAIWGVWAIILLIISRLIQGISTGGEYSGTLVSLIEQSTEKNGRRNRGFVGSIGTFLSNVGFFFSLLIINILQHYLSNAQMLAWGWRVPFFIGFVLGLIFFWLRMSIDETKLFIQAKEGLKIAKYPIISVFKYHKKAFWLSLIISLLSSVLYYIFFILFPMLNNLLGLKGSISINVVLFIFALLILLAGYLTDIYGRRKLLFIFALFAIIFGVVGIAIHLNSVTIYITVFAIFYAFILNSANLMAVEIFPTNCRYSGLGLSYNIANAVGGFVPMVTLIIFNRFHSLTTIILLIIVVLVILSTIIYFAVPEMAFRELEQ